MKNKELLAQQEAARQLMAGIPKPIVFPQIPQGFYETVKFGVEQLRLLKDAFGPMMQSLGEMLAAVNLEREKGKLLEGAGWLPHYTTPFDTIELSMDNADIQRVVSDYYRDESETVEQKFLEHVDSYDLDEELKATFREALACHRVGAYRATVRLLFPEIERVACKEIYGGTRNYVIEKTESGKVKKTKITSLPDFFDTAMRLPAGNILTYEYGWELLVKFGQHLYTPVDEADIPGVAADPVPNRHASLHGMVVYSTAQNSINALIMADFVFHVISAMKPYLVSDKEIGNKDEPASK